MVYPRCPRLDVLANRLIEIYRTEDAFSVSSSGDIRRWKRFTLRYEITRKNVFSVRNYGDARVTGAKRSGYFVSGIAFCICLVAGRIALHVRSLVTGAD